MANASTVWTKPYPPGGEGKIEEHLWTWTADDATGAITAEPSEEVITGWVMQAEVDPGSTAPTALYDITITNSGGADIFGTELNELSATEYEFFVPYVNGTNREVWVNSILTFNATGNSVNSATGTLKLTVRKP